MPRLYGDLAQWWPLLSPKEDYCEEAHAYVRLIKATCGRARTLLELGSGGGNNAYYMKEQFELTLVDLAPDMLEVSKSINPECAHLAGDMRSIRLEKKFDVVFIHDAIMSMQTFEDLKKVIEIAYFHCNTGGCVLVVPDFFEETFHPYTHHGGSDGAGLAMRYLEWSYDTDPTDGIYATDFLYVLHLADGTVRCENETHQGRLFSKAQWREAFADAGFIVRLEPLVLESGDSDLEVFIGTKP